MPLQITETNVEGITVLGIQGRITAKEAGEFRDEVSKRLAAGKIQLALDLSQTDYIDSMGLGAMVACHTHAARQGGAMALFHLNRRHVELMALTKLHTVFRVFAEQTDAVNSFFPGREVHHFDVLEFVRTNRRVDLTKPEDALS